MIAHVESKKVKPVKNKSKTVVVKGLGRGGARVMVFKCTNLATRCR